LPAYDTHNIQKWYKNGVLHRIDKDKDGFILPACKGKYPELEEWHVNGKLHRDDLDENGRVLPAVINSNGDKEWWVDGEKLKIN